jgi:uncharacterized membrane protein
MAICFILAILVLVSFPALGPWAISVFWIFLGIALFYATLVVIAVLAQLVFMFKHRKRAKTQTV